MPNPCRAALYLRVSTDQQTTENQRPDLARLARTRGWEIVKVYEETGSAAKQRPAFDSMMLDATRGHFDVLAVWSLDRSAARCRPISPPCSSSTALESRWSRSRRASSTRPVQSGP